MSFYKVKTSDFTINLSVEGFTRFDFVINNETNGILIIRYQTSNNEVINELLFDISMEGVLSWNELTFKTCDYQFLTSA